MAYIKKGTLFWLATGLLMSLFVFVVIFKGLAGDVLVIDPEGIPETTDAVMICVRTGAWKDLELLVSGNPALDIETGAENTAENLIWRAYQQSLHWEYEEAFRIQGAHITQCITVTCLDISKVTDIMTQILLRPVHCTADPEQRALTLRTAAEQALQSDGPTMRQEITLRLIRENGQWVVIPNDALLALLSGFIAP